MAMANPANGDEKLVGSERTTFSAVIVGTASPVLGRAIREVVDLILDALLHAAHGKWVWPDHEGQRNEYLHRRFINTQFQVGQESWKHFKKE